MFNFAERFWAWKKRKIAGRPVYTVQGYKVVQFDDKWAVKAVLPGTYRDLKGDHSWSSTSTWFRDCLATKEEIEKRFGKFIEKDA